MVNRKWTFGTLVAVGDSGTQGSQSGGPLSVIRLFLVAAGFSGRLDQTVVLRGFKDTLPCICRWVCRLSTPPFEFLKTGLRVSPGIDRAEAEGLQYLPSSFLGKSVRNLKHLQPLSGRARLNSICEKFKLTIKCIVCHNF